MNRHPTLRRLNCEWDELASLPVPASWSGEPALAGSESLGEVLALVSRDPDPVLWALLSVADAVAHRVVLQTMLGWAVRAAARDHHHDLDEYVGELWLGIVGYPLARRPARIAANLALDARKRVWARVRAVPVEPSRLAGLPGSPVRDRAGLVLDRARRTRLIDDQSDRALRLVYTHGLGSAEAAVVLGVTPAALRQRCRRALRLLAAHAADLGEVVG